MNTIMGDCKGCSRIIVLRGTRLCPACFADKRTCWKCGVKKPKSDMYLDATRTANDKQGYTWYKWLCGKCSIVTEKATK